MSQIEAAAENHRDSVSVFASLQAAAQANEALDNTQQSKLHLQRHLDGVTCETLG